MTTWEQVFSPVMAQGREVRQGQAVLGQAIIDAIENGSSLLGQASTGTGKSLAVAIPMIHAIKEAKAKQKSFRCVISTETITLQNQICNKDLPELLDIYGGFTFRKLLGRSNYLCFNIAKLNSVGNAKTSKMVEKLKTRQSNLGDGEQKDIERVLGYEIDKQEWERLASSSKFCADNQCDPEKCYSMRARDKAMKADLIVVNHAILATDIEMKITAGGGAYSDGMLGQIDVLAVDEGHQLEPVLVDQWTKELTVRELSDMSGSVTEGIDLARAVVSNESIGYTVNTALDGLQDLLANIQSFYSLLVERSNDKWKGSSSALSEKYLSGSVSPGLMSAMEEYETKNPARLVKAEQALEKAIKYFKSVVEQAQDQKVTGMRKINKGLRASKDLLDTVRIISKALETKDGIINQYGTYGAIVDGWERRDGTYGMTLRMVPLDISHKAKAIWAGVRTNILISATLTDLTDGSFRYARECVGFPKGAEVNVDTPFDLQRQQLTYVTKGLGNKVENAQYNLEELIELVNASRGRALLLFTSRRELDECADTLYNLRNLGYFDHHIYVQTPDCNKQKLVEDFKNHTDSILLGLRSMFVGVDIPGESLSLVALCRFPLPRFSVECKQQISHWRSRGFHKWYEREALTVFQQAFGRLIRSSTDRGVVALMDYRAADANERVYTTARLGVDAIGSPVTQDINVVQKFFDADIDKLKEKV